MSIDSLLKFEIRKAALSDLTQLVALENEWPPSARACAETLAHRIKKFPQGFFVAEDHSGIIASLICCPYHYDQHNLSNYHNWHMVHQKCYFEQTIIPSNALYIVSGTTKKNPYGSELFTAGINAVIDLAHQMEKTFAVAGCVLPGYAKFIEKQGLIDAAEYVFKQSQSRFIDPLIEKYRKLQFLVPDKHHILANYFQDQASLNYAALVVRTLKT